MKKLLTILLISALGGAAVQPAAYFSPKRLGMGGAGIAVVERENSYFYNPAHAAAIKSSFHLPPLLFMPNTIYYNAETPDVINKIGRSVRGDDDNKDSKTVETFREIIPAKLDLGSSYSAGLVFSLDNISSFALGVYGQGQVDAKVLNRLSPRFDLTGQIYGVPALIYAREIPLESLSQEPEDPTAFSLAAVLQRLKNPLVGITFKHISRASLYNPDKDEEILSLEVLELLGEDATPPLSGRVGFGLGIDLGAQTGIDTPAGVVTAAVVLNNLFTTLHGTQYEFVTSNKILDNFEKTTYQQTIPLTATFGLAMRVSTFANPPFQPEDEANDQPSFLSQTFKYAYGFMNFILPDTTYAADFDFIAPDSTFFQRLHLGLEQPYFGGLIDLRLGLNQGYPTFGLGANLGWYRVGFLYYTEELGREIGQQPVSYYVLHSSFVF
ncbi:MAG: hypothetical protein LBD62_04060 [Candidatus Margulisbacteria bacterium]|jgi:hypothetical protein|nr:hypothetical protein [Candidatus Margulisiibacteriota bacterium]